MGLVVKQDQSRGKLRSREDSLVALDRNRNEIILSRKTLSNADSSGPIFQSPTLITQLSPPSPSFRRGVHLLPFLPILPFGSLDFYTNLFRLPRSFRCDLNCEKKKYYVRPRGCPRGWFYHARVCVPLFLLQLGNYDIYFFPMIRRGAG